MPYDTGPGGAISRLLRPTRYVIDADVVISLGGVRMGRGRVQNISASGIAFECHARIQVGADVELEIIGIGLYRGEIVRALGIRGYGARFIQTPMEHQRLRERLAQTAAAIPEDTT